MENDSYYSYRSNNHIACEGEPYEISDCEPVYRGEQANSGYYYPPVARNFEYQDPVKHRICRETYNNMERSKPVKAQAQFKARDTYNHDYHTSAWDRLMKKTYKGKDTQPDKAHLGPKPISAFSNEIFEAGDLVIPSQTILKKSGGSRKSIKDENTNILNTNCLENDPIQEGLIGETTKPSKKFNHPNGQSRHSFKVYEHNPEKSDEFVKKPSNTTSSIIKSMRDHRSALADIKIKSNMQVDQKEALRYNLKSKDFEYSQNYIPPKPQRGTVKHQREASEPIWVSSNPQLKPSRKMHQPSNHTSQIVFEEIQESKPVRRRNHTRASECMKPSGLKRERASTAKGRKPQQIRNAFQSQITLS